MSTTVVHPESVSGHGPSGRTIGMAVAGLVVAAALGFAITNQSAPETGVAGSAQVDPADIKYQQMGATRAAAEAARRQTALQEATTGVVPQVTETAPVSSQVETARLQELHPSAPLPERQDFLNAQALTRAQAQNGTAPFTERGDIGSGSVGNVANPQGRAEFLKSINIVPAYSVGVSGAIDKQQAQWESKAGFLEEQYQSQNLPGLNPGDSGIR